jgi:regulator of sigma E protease
MDFWITLLQFVGALVALIIVHELGHFIAARLFKVEVEEFGIGFPPRLFTLFHAWGTKFTLNAIPLGGFVRPKGENDPNAPGGLAAANPWVRLVVLFAGPMANLLLAVILYAAVFSRIGTFVYEDVLVVGVAENSPAMQAGLQENDVIRRVAGVEIDSREAIHTAISANLGQEIEIVYERNGQLFTSQLTPRTDPPENQGAIGITMGYPTRSVSVVEALPTGALAVVRHSQLLVELPFRLVRGDIDPEEGRLVGLKGMFDIYQEVREGEAFPDVPAGVSAMLFFTNITISLGLLNLFPFPALDGGRILFTMPEIILRRRVPPEYENVINLVGFAILLLLLLYINIQDFIVPVSLPR